MTFVFLPLKIGIQTEIIVQKVPPMNCRVGCPEWSGDLATPSEICETCCQRPIKCYELCRLIGGKRTTTARIPAGAPYPLDRVWEEKIEELKKRRIEEETW